MATHQECLQVDDAYEGFKAQWRGKTVKQIEKEITSWRKYMQKHSAAYSWHGKYMTPPGSLGDGDKLAALREVLEEKTGRRDPC